MWVKSILKRLVVLSKSVGIAWDRRALFANILTSSMREERSM